MNCGSESSQPARPPASLTSVSVYVISRVLAPTTLKVCRSVACAVGVAAFSPAARRKERGGGVPPAGVTGQPRDALLASRASCANLRLAAQERGLVCGLAAAAPAVSLPTWKRGEAVPQEQIHHVVQLGALCTHGCDSRPKPITNRLTAGLQFYQHGALSHGKPAS